MALLRYRKLHEKYNHNPNGAGKGRRFFGIRAAIDGITGAIFS